MAFIVGKENQGPLREFKTRAGLERALRKAGAESITWSTSRLIVVWPVDDPHANGETATYPIAPDGRVDPQLAWDMAS